MFKRLVYSETFASKTRWFFLFILIPPFILSLWMGVRPPRGSADASAGIIFGHPIPRDAFQQEYALIRRNLEAQFGGEMPEQMDSFLRQQTWDRLILREEARRMIQVSDDEVAAFIRSQTTFQDKGRFAPDLYYRIVRGMGMSPQLFEERVRDDLRIRRLVERVKADAQVTDDEIRDAYAKDRERIRASLVMLLTSSFEPQVPALTEDDLRAYYSAHHDQWQAPAQRTIEYLGLPFSEALKQQPAPSDEQIHTYYDAHQESFADADGKPKPLDAVKDQVRQQAQAEGANKQLTNFALDLQDDMDTGLRFVEIALSRQRMIHRTDPLTASTVSDITDGPTSSMLAAAFEGPVGGLAKVQHDSTGAFLLRSVEEVPARLRPFEEVRGELERPARAERAGAMAKERADALHEKLAQLREKGFTLEEACLVADATRVFTQPFARQEPLEFLGHEPDLTQALFGLSLGGMTPVIKTDEGFVIGFLEDRLPFDEAKFEEEKDSYRQTVLDTKQQERLSAWIESLRTKAKLKSFLEPST